MAKTGGQPPTSVTVGEALVTQLRSWAVPAVFAVPGSSYLPVLDALSRQKDITLYTMRHEEAASLAASAYAKLTGELGVCMAHCGPGAVHLLNGLYDAKLDGAPVLALTGQVSTDKMGTDSKQVSDENLLFEDSCLFNETVADAKEALPLLLRAMRSAVVSNQVAHLGLPQNILAQTLQPTYGPPEDHLTTPPALDLLKVDEAMELVGQAKKPLILIGRGCEQVGAKVLTLARQIGAAVVVTLLAKGIVDESDPIVMGVLGEAGNSSAQQAAADTDLVIVLGATWWPSAFFAGGVRVLQVDRRPASIGEDHPLTLGVAARVEDFVPELIRRTANMKPAAFAATMQKTKAETVAREKPPAAKRGLHPLQVLRSLRSAVPEDSVLCVDTGAHTLWFGGHYEARGETVLASGKWRTMGFALPAAIAAKIARPHRAVIALMGDGGFAMVMQELATAVRYKLPVIVLVFNNGLLAEEAYRQEIQGYNVYGMQLFNPNFAAFAKTCGAVGTRVDDQKDLEKALQDALKSTKATLIDIVLDPSIKPPLLGAESGAASSKQEH